MEPVSITLWSKICGEITGFEKKNISEIILVSPKSNKKCSYKREAEEDLRKRRGRGSVHGSDHEGRYWSYMVTGQGMPTTPGSWRQNRSFSRFFRGGVALVIHGPQASGLPKTVSKFFQF